jgi:hypothetical protein
MADAELYKVAYDEAVRALSEQQAAIESVRSRAGLLLSAAAVTTSFLGAQALQGGDSSLFSGLALLGFVAVAATSLAILWPRSWESTANSRRVLESCIESAEEIRIEDLYRDLSFRMQVSFSSNHRGLNELAALFQAASGLLTIEVVLWIAAIAANL